MVCWLPQRFDDLIYRIDVLHHDERGLDRDSDYILIFEDNEKIVGVVIPDGGSFNSCIKTGYENIFSQMIDLSEKELQPLFKRDENGDINFLVVSHDSLTYQKEELTDALLTDYETAMTLFQFDSSKRILTEANNFLLSK